MLDGYGGEESLLDDRALVEHCLKDLPVQIGMNILFGPEVVHAGDNGKKDPGGWSGFLIIAESHISIHTFPKRGFVSIDVYTCKEGLGIEFISNYFREVFKLKELETNFVKRGTKYPSENIY